MEGTTVFILFIYHIQYIPRLRNAHMTPLNNNLPQITNEKCLELSLAEMFKSSRSTDAGRM